MERWMYECIYQRDRCVSIPVHVHVRIYEHSLGRVSWWGFLIWWGFFMLGFSHGGVSSWCGFLMVWFPHDGVSSWRCNLLMMWSPHGAVYSWFDLLIISPRHCLFCLLLLLMFQSPHISSPCEARRLGVRRRNEGQLHGVRLQRRWPQNIARYFCVCVIV